MLLDSSIFWNFHYLNRKISYFKWLFDVFHNLLQIYTLAQHIKEILILNDPNYSKNYIIYIINKIQ